jgi:hypothetical protein
MISAFFEVVLVNLFACTFFSSGIVSLIPEYRVFEKRLQIELKRVSLNQFYFCDGESLPQAKPEVHRGVQFSLVFDDAFIEEFSFSAVREG